MAASDYVPIFFKNRLHLAGRPQMSTHALRLACAVSDEQAAQALRVHATHLFEQAERLELGHVPLPTTVPGQQ